jgi:hypothetical protein
MLTIRRIITTLIIAAAAVAATAVPALAHTIEGG